MAWDRIENNWDAFKPRIRERWARLAPVEIDAVQGQRDRLVERIEEAYRIDRSEAEAQVEEFEQKAKAGDDWQGPAGPGRRTP